MICFVYTLFTVSSLVSSQSEYRLAELFWPESWVISQIELSTNHHTSYTDLSLYLYTALNISTCFASITLPQLSPTYSCSISEFNSKDYKILCPSISLSSGLYGPINLQIKTSESGKILAQAPNFGTFYILPPEPKNKLLGVTVESDTFKINSSCTLSFNLTITEPVHKNDYLVLTIDENFSYNPSGIGWRFEYNGSFSFLTTQWLYEEDSRKLYIYGITEEIVPILSIGFELAGFTGPSSVVSDFYWELGIHRFGLNTLIDKFSGTGPDLPLNQGNVEIADWKFVHSELDILNSVVGLVTYTELSFAIENEVPVGGWVDLSYSGVDICSYTAKNYGNQNLTQTKDFEDCGLFVNCSSDATVFECEVKSSENLICTVKESALVAGSTIFVYNLIEITENSKVNSIETFDYYGNGIDSASDTVGIDTGIDSYIDISVISFVHSEDNSSYVNKAGTSGYFGLIVEFVTSQALQPGDNLTLYLPITKKSSFTEHFVGIGQHFYAKYAVTDGLSYSETTDFTSFSNFSVSEGLITVKIIENIDEHSTFILYLGCEDSDGDVSGMFMPLIPNDIAYLSQVVLRILTTNTNFVYSAPFYMSNSDLNTWFTPFCRNVWVEGLPIEVFIQLDYYLRSHTYLFFAVFEFDDLNPGLASGDSYPSKPSGAEFLEPNGIKYHFEWFKQSVSQSFIIPFYKLSAKVHHMKCSLYYKDKAGASKIMGIGEFSYDLSGITEKTKENGEELNGIDLQSTVSLNFEIGSVDEEAYNIAVLWDFGFELNSLKINSALNIEYLNSELLTYSAGLFTDVLGTSKSGGKYSIQIKNVWFTAEDYYVYFVYMAGEKFIDGGCTGVVQSTIHNETPLSLELRTYKPETEYGYSFGSETMNIELLFQFEGIIKKGSYLTITQGGVSLSSVSDTDWQVSSGSTQLAGSYSSYWQSTKMTAVLSNTLKIKVKNVKKPVIHSTTKMKLLLSVVVFSENGEKSFQWVQKDSEAICTFRPGNIESGKSGVKQISVFPNTIGSDLVRFFVSFKPEKDIQEGSTVYIDAHFENSVVGENVWCNFDFKDARIVEGVLSLILEERVNKDDLVELVKDEAFNITSKMIRTVSIWAKKDSFTIILDDTETIKTQEFSVTKTPSYQITELSTSVSLSTPGFQSFHYFEFYLSKKTSEDWTFIFEFSKVYNSNIGPFQIFFYLPGSRYLSVTDETGEKILCPVKNWMVLCKPGKIYAENSKISLKLSVLNPYPDGLVSLYILNGKGELVVVPKTNILFQYSSNPLRKIDIQYVMFDYEDELELMGSLTLQVFADLEIEEDDVLKLTLPGPYNLGLYNISSFNCSISNEAGDSMIEDGNCEVDGNTVIFIFNQECLFKSSECTNITIRNLYKPDTGYSRDLWTYESTGNVYWTQKFKIFVEHNRKVLAQSIENIHSGFIGFNNSGLTRIQVNSGKTIEINPGVFFGKYLISAGDTFLSEKVKVSARVDKSSAIVLSDGGEYELSLQKPFVYFSIGVDANTEEGFYYIYWDIHESPLIDYEYLPPLPSVVKVEKLESLFEIEVETGFSVIQGVISQPIYIKTQDYGKHSVRPYDQLQVNLGIFEKVSELDIQFLPNPVSYLSSASNASFSILCNNCRTDFEYEINATVLSNNSLFHFPKLSKFYVETRPNLKPECDLGVIKVNPCTLSVSITTNSPSRIVWALISEHLLDSDPKLIKKSTILSNSYDYAAPNNDLLNLQEQFTSHSEYIDNLLIGSNYSYQDFAFNLMGHSKSIYFTSISILPKGTSHLFTFSKLLPSSTYFIQAFVDNFSGTQDSICSSYTTTDNYEPIGKLTFSYSGNFESTYIIERLSQIYQINSYFFRSLPANRRFLLDSSIYLVYSSITEGTSGYDLAASVSEASLLLELQALGVVQVDISELDPLDYDRMYWLESLKTEWKYEDDQMTFNFVVSTSGTLYCMVQEQLSTNETMSRDSILAGACWHEDKCWISIENVKAGSQEWVFNTTENQLGDGQFRIDCIACNLYPITPSCSSIKNTTIELIFKDLSWGSVISPVLVYFLVNF